MLIPAGRIEAVDGREFVNDAPEAILAAFEREGLVLPIDVNHKMEVMDVGEDVPAMGWIVALEEREGAIWARVEWTPRGEKALRAREYRYISPAFLHDQHGRILELVSAALVTQPAFRMPALAGRMHSHPDKEETGMDKKALCARLGLPEDADDAAVLAAIDELKKGLAAARPADPEKFVPRADYDRVLAELAGAKKALAEREARELRQQAEQLIGKGIEAGQIAPASKEFWLEMACESKAGLEKLQRFLASAPKVVDAQATPPEPPQVGRKKALSAAERQVAAALGLTEEEFIAAQAEAAEPADGKEETA